MVMQQLWRWMRCIGMLGAVGMLAAGCAIRDPQALQDISQACQSIDHAKQAGAAERFPEAFAELEKRYLQTRGVFYACQDDQASEMALTLAADANALASKQVLAPQPPPPNRPPKAVLLLPSEAEVNQTLQFRSTGSADPDGDPITYHWSFGDDTTSSQSDPTHRYMAPGHYTVRLTVQDNRGGEDDVRDSVTVIRRVVLDETRGVVLFDLALYQHCCHQGQSSAVT
jgi:hypothetical protein